MDFPKIRVPSTWQAIHPVKLQTLAGLPRDVRLAGSRIPVNSYLDSFVGCRYRRQCTMRGEKRAAYLPVEPWVMDVSPHPEVSWRTLWIALCWFKPRTSKGKRWCQSQPTFAIRIHNKIFCATDIRVLNDSTHKAMTPSSLHSHNLLLK